MRLILTFGLLIIAGCASATSTAPAPSPLQEWRILQVEVLSTIRGETPCGPVSMRIGFCRPDAREAPTPDEAALAESCRGQPSAHLARFGTSARDMDDRRAVAEALGRLFTTAQFADPTPAGSDQRALLKAFHDRDQALRSFRPDFQAGNPTLVDNGKWVAICAHAILARNVVSRFISQTTPQALATDEELANYAWLLAQHSDFDPQYQFRMSGWFGQSAAPHMRRHSAYLYDRAAVGLDREQRFGTQIRCQNGAWGPFPVEDPANLDARRATLGLPAMAEHLAGRRPCPPAS